MSVAHASVSVGTSAVSLLTINDKSYQNPDVARSIVVTNESANVVLIGGSDVTATTYGYKLVAGASLSLDLDNTDVPFAIAATAGNTCRVLHLGV